MSERDHQVFVFQILELNEAQYPFLKFVYAVPNGGHRHPAVAGKLKAEGVKRGVPDICIPIPRCGKHGFYIEMKDGKNKCTAEQTAFLSFLANQEYNIATCYGADQALDCIEAYLGLQLRGRG